MAKPLPAGVINIRGKEYTTVALRVHQFRTECPSLSLITEVLHRDVDCVVMKATIVDEQGRVLATGHAEEYRKASEINRTSALENCETSAIGRALAAYGFGGTEFASADEVARAISGAKGEPVKHEPVKTEPIKPGVISATDGAADALQEQERMAMQEVALFMIDMHRNERDMEAIRVWYDPATFESNEQRVYVWSLLKTESKLRAVIKANNPNEQKEAA